MMMEDVYDDRFTGHQDVRSSDGSSHYFYRTDFKKTGGRWNTERLITIQDFLGRV